MDEPLRKLKIDGGDLEPNNEDPSTSMICFTPHRHFRTLWMSLMIPI